MPARNTDAALEGDTWYCTSNVQNNESRTHSMVDVALRVPGILSPTIRQTGRLQDCLRSASLP